MCLHDDIWSLSTDETASLFVVAGSAFLYWLVVMINFVRDFSEKWRIPKKSFFVDLEQRQCERLNATHTR